MNKKIQKTIENLQKNNVNVIYCKDKTEVVKKAKELLKPNATVAAGGSVSLVESGVWELINSGDYNFFDRNREGITAEEKQQVFKDIIGIDYYFCSTNAVTVDGELLNVDGLCNRISAIAFGPQRVIMVVGANKIVDNLKDAFLRVKKVVAPKNCVRLGIDNPCVKLGHCISLEKSDNPNFTDGCRSPRRICINYLTSGFQREKDRITVLLCEEALGY